MKYKVGDRVKLNSDDEINIGTITETWVIKNPIHNIYYGMVQRYNNISMYIIKSDPIIVDDHFFYRKDIIAEEKDITGKIRLNHLPKWF